MAQTQTVAQRLYDLLVTRGFDPVTKDPQTGKDVTPANARIISFDYRSSSGRDYGNAVLILSDKKELLLFFGDSMGRSMESPRDKNEWYDFLHQLGQFATHNGFNTFSPQNISNLKHYMASMSAISEGLFESYYGTRQVSYMGQPTQARLMIRHNRTLGETDARYRYVEKLFVETQDHERFLLPFTNLAGGRAMLEHVRQGGRPYDIRGQHIAEMIQDMKVLARFHRAHQGQVLEGQRQQLVEQAREYYQQLRSNVQQLGHSRGYSRYFESWQPAEITAADTLVENLRDMFVEQHIDTRVEAALPLLARIQGTAMKEADIFENWANTVAEGLSDLADDHDAVNQIQELLAKKPLAVGENGMNVIPQLEDIIGYDRDDPQDHRALDDLRERLQNLSQSNSADADAAPIIEAWLEENGVDIGTTEPDEPQAPEPAPVSEPAPEPAPAAAAPTASSAPPVAEDSSWDPGEKYKNMFAEKLAAELDADVDDIQDNIYDEDMKTPSGVPYYFYYDSETASTNYMGVIGGKPTAIVYTDHGGGGDDNEIEMSVNDRVRYVIKYGDPEQGATLNAIMPAKMVKGFPVAPRKVIAQTKPGQDWQAMIGLGLDMLWNRMQHKFLETADVTDYNPPSQGGTRQELVAKYHQTKDPKDAEAARRAGATQQELQGVAEGQINKSAFSPEEIAAINQYLDDEISFHQLRRGYPGVISKAARQFGISPVRGFVGEIGFYDRMVQARDEGDIPEPGVAEGEYDHSELYNGCYVRDEQDGANGEVFRMSGDPEDRRVRIEDKDGRGWYISPHRLQPVDENDPAVARWFGNSRDEDDLDEGKWFRTAYGWAGGAKPGGGKYKHPETVAAERRAKLAAKKKAEQAAKFGKSNGEQGMAKEPVNELSKDTLKSYHKKAVDSLTKGTVQTDKYDKREAGAMKAYRKAYDQTGVAEQESTIAVEYKIKADDGKYHQRHVVCDKKDLEAKLNQLRNKRNIKDIKVVKQGVAEGDNLATFVGPNEDSTDAMDHRGAVTDSFTEDLARIKTLALSK